MNTNNIYANSAFDDDL